MGIQKAPTAATVCASVTDPVGFLNFGHLENTEQQCEVGESTDSKMGILFFFKWESY